MTKWCWVCEERTTLTPDDDLCAACTAIISLVFEEEQWPTDTEAIGRLLSPPPSADPEP